MTRLLLILLSLLFSSMVFSKQKKKTIYKYKKYEKFDFEDLNILGESGSPGDLSITPRYLKQFSNKLPYRKTFTPEIRKAVERVR